MECADYLIILREVFPEQCNEDTEILIEDVLDQLAGRSDDEILERLSVILTDDFSLQLQAKMNYLRMLSEMFPNHTQDTIGSVIEDVEQEMLNESQEVKMERMCVLLIGDFSDQNPSQGKIIEEDNNTWAQMSLEEQVKIRFPDVCPHYLGKLVNVHKLDYPTIVKTFDMNGYKKVNPFEDPGDAEPDNILQEVLKLFPSACESYVKKIIRSGLNLDQVIEQFSNGNYVKSPTQSSKNCNKVHKRLCEMLPNFDPDYLKEEALKLDNATDEAISQSIEHLMTLKEYPTITQYKHREEQKSLLLSYLFDFKLDDFLEEVNYSFDEFENTSTHALEAGQPLELEQDKHFALYILKLVYTRCDETQIETALVNNNYNIVKCCSMLGAVHNRNLKKNELILPENSFNNKQLFRELAYVIFKPLLVNYNSLRNNAYNAAFEEAKSLNALLTCKCCFDDKLVFLPNECFVCRNGCVFCKDCMRKGCEVSYSNGNLEITCFANCGTQFTDETLYRVMNKVSFCKLMQRKQYKEIREANVDGLETCPFCDFSTVIERDDKIFKCQECGKESCRECRHEAHVPLRCTEIEYDEDVKMRTFIENKMADALMRTCKKCSKRIIKESGCNKMTCDCGTTMCYVCGASQINYNHFTTLGCPQMSDQETLHRNNVLDGIQEAKRELGVDGNPAKLKFDPSLDF